MESQDEVAPSARTCPPGEELRAAWTAEVRAFVAAAGTRRALPVTVHVGSPGGERISFPDDRDADGVLRGDLVASALAELPGAAYAWVTRRGELEPDFVDQEWWAAARVAFARHGSRLSGFAVLTRRGWHDLPSGEQQAWQRVRATRRLG